MTEKKTVHRGLIWTLLCSLGFTVVASVVCVVYTGITVEQNNQRWCTAVIAVDDAFHESTAQSPAAKRIAESYSRLRKEFKC